MPSAANAHQSKKIAFLRSDPLKNLPSVLLACAYLIYASILAIHHPLCCADDASFAVVSKNIAHGLGYALTLNYQGPEYALHLFDPALGTGPTLIFSAAILIKIFGAAPWIPGEATVLLCALFIFGIGTQLSITFGRKRGNLIAAVFLLTAIIATALDFNYWSAELGEAPAALAVILGYLFWINREERACYSYLAGTFVALSFLTKELSAIYVVALLAFALFQAAANISKESKTNPYSRLNQQALLIVGMAVPVLIFELYRLASFGSLHAYIQNWHSHLAFVAHQGITSNAPSLLTRLIHRLHEIAARFSLTPAAFIIGSSAIILGSLGERSRRRDLFILLALGAILHVLYWFFISNGWTRYAFSFVLIWIFLVACQIVQKRKLAAILSLCALALIAVSSLPHIRYLKDQLSETGESSRNPLANERQILQYISENKIQPPIYTGWWAQVASLEFLASGTQNFEGYQLANRDQRSSFNLLTNSRFPNPSGSLRRVLDRCVIAVQSGDYTLYSCKQPPAIKLINAGTLASMPARTSSAGECNIESLNGDSAAHQWVIDRARRLELSGWLIDPKDQIVPKTAQIVFEGLSQHDLWLAPISSWQDRPDVASAKQSNKFLRAGFTIYVGSAALKKGQYRIWLQYDIDGYTVKCDNGRMLYVR